MALKGRDREFRLNKLSYIDFKPLNMDRVLTMLFPAAAVRRLRDAASSTQERANGQRLCGGVHQGPAWLRRLRPASRHRRALDRDGSHGFGEPGEAEPGLGRTSATTRQHLQVPQRAAHSGLWRRRADLLDALSRAPGPRTSRSRRTPALLLPRSRPAHRPVRRVGHRRCRDAGAASLRPASHGRRKANQVTRIGSLHSASARPICWQTTRCACSPTSRTCHAPCSSSTSRRCSRFTWVFTFSGR